MLQGDEETLSYIDNYNIGSINLAEITDTQKTFEFTVQSQNGIEILSDSKTIAVTVDLGNAETKTFRLSSAILANVNFLNVPEGKTPRITNSYRVISLRAQDYTLEELTSESFSLSVDLASQTNENGEYQLIVELPSGVYGGFLNRYYVNVELEDAQ